MVSWSYTGHLSNFNLLIEKYILPDADISHTTHDHFHLFHNNTFSQFRTTLLPFMNYDLDRNPHCSFVRCKWKKYCNTSKILYAEMVF